MVEHITSTRRSTVWALTKDQRRVPVAHPAGRAPPMTESSCSARRVVGRICSPGLFEIPHQRRVNEQAPERCNASHIEPSKQTVRLHQHGHLAAVAAGIVGDPAHVHHRVDGPVRQLGSPLIVSEIDRTEGECVELRSGRGIVQIGRNRPRRVGTREPTPESGLSHPSSSPSFQRIANSVRAIKDGLFEVSPAAVCRTNRGKSSGPPRVGSAHTS